MQRPPILSGDKVYLARFRREDIEVIAPHMCNLELTTLLRGHGLTFSLEDEQDWFESVSKNKAKQVIFAILTLEHRLVGGVDLRESVHRTGAAELGIAVYDSSDWNQGYGSEAVNLMLRYGMYHLNLYNVLLTVFSFNARAIRAYQKAGFKEIGRRRGAVVLGGERFDQVYMDITRDEINLETLNMFSGKLEE